MRKASRTRREAPQQVVDYMARCWYRTGPARSKCKEPVHLGLYGIGLCASHWEAVCEEHRDGDGSLALTLGLHLSPTALKQLEAVYDSTHRKDHEE